MTPGLPPALRAALAGLALAGLLGVAGPVAGQDDGPDLVAERARIKSERDSIGALKAQAQRACQDRFAVNDCLNAVERRWREPLADLRRQENAIQDVERRRRSAEQVRQNEARAAQAQADAAQRREQALQDQKDREARAASKAGGPRPTGEPRPVEAQPQPAPGPSREQAAANASERARRVQEAQERKRKAQARAAQEAGPVRPLPVPP